MIHMVYAVVTAAAEMAAAVTAVAVMVLLHAMTALMTLQRMVQNAVIQHGMSLA